MYLSKKNDVFTFMLIFNIGFIMLGIFALLMGFSDEFSQAVFMYMEKKLK